MIKLIEKIEGEAKLDFTFKDGVIDDVSVDFMSTRHIEDILKARPAQDALVINPRVCGICGHAHLIATVKALEDCYETIEVSEKAKIIRELTLNFELIQNHFKWFYLTIFPLFGLKQEVRKATYPSQLMAKAIAVLGGQYPHTSYAVVGGVTNEVTHMDMLKISNYIDETFSFFQKNVLNVPQENVADIKKLFSLYEYDGDLIEVLRRIEKNGWCLYGRSYDRFICFGENGVFKRGKFLNKRVYKTLSLDGVKESSSSSSFAKSVMYNDKHYEVGPLARAMVAKDQLIRDVHKRYDDSMFTRILARVYETAKLLVYCKQLIERIDLSQPSYIEPKISLNKINGTGKAAVEAARGSLIHKVSIKEGNIQSYEIITPTQWNLCGGEGTDKGVSQLAMLGLKDVKTAEIVFKSFDVCSVCTTH